MTRPGAVGGRVRQGSRSGSDPANDTTGSGVFVEPVPETGLTVCGGRPVDPGRETPRIAMLVMVASRFIDALGGRRRLTG